MRRKNPSEGGSWQREDKVWESALLSPDNFYFLNLMSIFLYSGAVVEIINLGSSRKNTWTEQITQQFDNWNCSSAHPLTT